LKVDLKDLHAEQDPIDVALIFDEDGNPTDGFKVVGADSDQYQAADRAWKLVNVKKASRAGYGINTKTNEGATELLNQLKKREFVIAKACIVGIYGFTSGGEPALLNDETLEAIFKARPTWRTKVVAAIEAEQVFTQA
jgi:hypothetical protein